MVRPNPNTEISDILAVQRDSFSSDLVQFVLSQDQLSDVHGRREDSKLGLRSHVKIGAAVAATGDGGGIFWLRSLGYHKRRTTRETGWSHGERSRRRGKQCERKEYSVDDLHGDVDLLAMSL